MRLMIVALVVFAISVGGCASWKEEAMKEPKVTRDPVTGKESYSQEYAIFSTSTPDKIPEKHTYAPTP